MRGLLRAFPMPRDLAGLLPTPLTLLTQDEKNHQFTPSHHHPTLSKPQQLSFHRHIQCQVCSQPRPTSSHHTCCSPPDTSEGAGERLVTAGGGLGRGALLPGGRVAALPPPAS